MLNETLNRRCRRRLSLQTSEVNIGSFIVGPQPTDNPTNQDLINEGVIPDELLKLNQEGQTPLQLRLTQMLRQPVKLPKVTDERAKLPNFNESLRACRYDFPDNLLLDKEGICLEKWPTAKIVLVGRWCIPMLHSGFNRQGAAAIFVLAYNLKYGTPTDLKDVFSDEDVEEHTSDIVYETLTAVSLGSFHSHQTLRGSTNLELEAAYYCFIAASLLRIFTKSAENYINSWIHINEAFPRFYASHQPVHPTGPCLGAIQALSAYWSIDPMFKNTLFKILYAGGKNKDGENLKSFLYDIHLANTGLHIWGIFIKLCKVLNCPSRLMITVLDCTETKKQMKALENLLMMDVSNEDIHQRRMWRYGRIFDRDFMSDLQTKACPKLVYALASALKEKSPADNKGILEIVQLKNLSAEIKMKSVVAGKQIVRAIRNYMADESERRARSFHC